MESASPPPKKKKISKANKDTVCSFKAGLSLNLEAKYKKIQYFNDSWKKDFPWVQSSELGRTYFKCKFCPKSYSCGNDGITAVKRHGLTVKHKAAAYSVNKTKNLFDICKEQGDHTTRARRIELQLSMLLIQKNLPISLSGDLIDFIKHLDIDKSVQKLIKCDRTKTTALICNVIGRKSSEDLFASLRKQVFSIIIDESTDISTEKHLALCCRYSTPQGIRDEFLGLLQVEDGTHIGLYESIVKFFEKSDIPYRSNMIGYASDGANVMFGDKNSVLTKFKKDIPHLFTMKCICHSLAKAASNAAKQLPAEIEKFMKNVYGYLKHSSKRKQALAELQVALEVPEHKILKFYDIRWLSLLAAVKRFIEQYDVLFRFFEAESRAKIEDAKVIFEHLRNRWTLIYLQFLEYSLSIVMKRNVEFQSESPKIHVLYQKMEDLFKKIVALYMNEDYVDRTDPQFINFAEVTKETERYWEPLRNIDLGPKVSAELARLPSTMPVNEIQNFRMTCRKFLIELASEIYTRFPFKEKSIKLLQELRFIEPINLKTTRNIAIVAEFFGFDVEQVHQEFRSLKTMFKSDLDTDRATFWAKVRAHENANGSVEFPLLLQIIDRIEVLPHSSANVERIFSQINLNKTKLRNHLNTKTTAGILYGKAFVKDRPVTSIDCTELLPMINKNMY